MIWLGNNKAFSQSKLYYKYAGILAMNFVSKAAPNNSFQTVSLKGINS